MIFDFAGRIKTVEKTLAERDSTQEYDTIAAFWEDGVEFAKCIDIEWNLCSGAICMKLQLDDGTEPVVYLDNWEPIYTYDPNKYSINMDRKNVLHLYNELYFNLEFDPEQREFHRII